jgi:hypothetical protein
LNHIEKSKKDGSNLSERIGKLFEILNWPDTIRAQKTLVVRRAQTIPLHRYINSDLKRLDTRKTNQNLSEKQALQARLGSFLALQTSVFSCL